jgi:hypothetical protein
MIKCFGISAKLTAYFELNSGFPIGNNKLIWKQVDENQELVAFNKNYE